MRRGLLIAALVCGLWSDARSAHIDPFDVVTEAAAAWKRSNRYADVRAVLSQALRQAQLEGPLSPEFALVLAMYADVARHDGSPAFALQLADDGLSLVQSGANPDTDLRYALLVSRSYALAELGRFGEALASARMASLWMGEKFGADQRGALEGAIKDWSDKVSSVDPGAVAPPIAEQVLDLIDQAEDAYRRNDSGAAIALASRAMLPSNTALSETDVRYINARAQAVLGAAYGQEGRKDAALAALRNGADLLCLERWDGKSPLRLRPEVRIHAAGRRAAFDVFSHLMAAASRMDDVVLAQAAGEAATEFASTPEDRFSLLVLKAALMARSDFAEAEKMLAGSEREALAAGDHANAALAVFYQAVTRLFRAKLGSELAEREQVIASARAAAAIATVQQADFVLSTAVRMLYRSSYSHRTAIPLVAEAFDAFTRWQRALQPNESGQEATRRDRREFLEYVIGSSYDAEHPE